MNKQEVIKKLKAAIPEDILDNYQRGEKAGLNFALLLVEELEKPVVPQFVADWYEEHKGYFDFNINGFYKYFYSQGKHEVVKKWIDNADNKAIETLVKMKLYGYEVEKEKLYTVEIPNPNRADVSLALGSYNDGKVAIFAVFTDSWKYEKQYKLTEAEIKKDFEWAWQFAKEVDE